MCCAFFSLKYKYIYINVNITANACHCKHLVFSHRLNDYVFFSLFHYILLHFVIFNLILSFFPFSAMSYCILLNSRSLSMCEVVQKSIIFWLSCTATGPKLCSFIKMSLLNNPLCLPLSVCRPLLVSSLPRLSLSLAVS